MNTCLWRTTATHNVSDEGGEVVLVYLISQAEIFLSRRFLLLVVQLFLFLP